MSDAYTSAPFATDSESGYSSEPLRAALPAYQSDLAAPMLDKVQTGYTSFMFVASEGTGKQPSQTLDSLARIDPAENWNERFQKLRHVHATSTREMMMRADSFQALANEFEAAARDGAVQIVDARHLPVAEQPIKPLDVGGVAGGTKYLHRGIFFKFALDTHGLYGSDERAMRAASHELTSLAEAFYEEVAGLCFPLMAVVDYRGLRLIATSVLPISSSTLVYGSADGGRTVVNSDPEAARLMDELGERLNLKAHVVGVPASSRKVVMRVPGDVEVHRGTDGRLYVVDLARLFPARPPGARGDSLCNLLRPEAVRRSARPLCSDAFTNWQAADPAAVENNNDVAAVVAQLRESGVASLAEGLDKAGARVVTADLARACHVAGINVAMLGLVAAAVRSAEARAHVISEMIVRALKCAVRAIWRTASGVATEASASSVRELFAAVQSFTDDWRTGVLVPLLRAKYDGPWRESDTVLPAEVRATLAPRLAASLGVAAHNPAGSCVPRVRFLSLVPLYAAQAAYTRAQTAQAAGDAAARDALVLAADGMFERALAARPLHAAVWLSWAQRRLYLAAVAAETDAPCAARLLASAQNSLASAAALPHSAQQSAALLANVAAVTGLLAVVRGEWSPAVAADCAAVFAAAQSRAPASDPRTDVHRALVLQARARAIVHAATHVTAAPAPAATAAARLALVRDLFTEALAAIDSAAQRVGAPTPDVEQQRAQLWHNLATSLQQLAPVETASEAQQCYARAVSAAQGWLALEADAPDALTIVASAQSRLAARSPDVLAALQKSADGNPSDSALALRCAEAEAAAAAECGRLRSEAQALARRALARLAAPTSEAALRVAASARAQLALGACRDARDASAWALLAGADEACVEALGVAVEREAREAVALAERARAAASSSEVAQAGAAAMIEGSARGVLLTCALARGDSAAADAEVSACLALIPACAAVQRPAVAGRLARDLATAANAPGAPASALRARLVPQLESVRDALAQAARCEATLALAMLHVAAADAGDGPSVEAHASAAEAAAFVAAADDSGLPVDLRCAACIAGGKAALHGARTRDSTGRAMDWMRRALAFGADVLGATVGLANALRCAAHVAGVTVEARDAALREAVSLLEAPAKQWDVARMALGLAVLDCATVELAAPHALMLRRAIAELSAVTGPSAECTACLQGLATAHKTLATTLRDPADAAQRDAHLAESARLLGVLADQAGATAGGASDSTRIDAANTAMLQAKQAAARGDRAEAARLLAGAETSLQEAAAELAKSSAPSQLALLFSAQLTLGHVRLTRGRELGETAALAGARSAYEAARATRATDSTPHFGLASVGIASAVAAAASADTAAMLRHGDFARAAIASGMPLCAGGPGSAEALNFTLCDVTLCAVVLTSVPQGRTEVLSDWGTRLAGLGASVIALASPNVDALLQVAEKCLGVGQRVPSLMAALLPRAHAAAEAAVRATGGTAYRAMHWHAFCLYTLANANAVGWPTILPVLAAAVNLAGASIQFADLDHYAMGLAHCGKYAEAVVVLQRAATMDPAHSCYNLACCLAHENRLDEARQAMEAALAAGGLPPLNWLSQDADIAVLRAQPWWPAFAARL